MCTCESLCLCGMADACGGEQGGRGELHARQRERDRKGAVQVAVMECSEAPAAGVEQSACVLLSTLRACRVGAYTDGKGGSVHLLLPPSPRCTERAPACAAESGELLGGVRGSRHDFPPTPPPRNARDCLLQCGRARGGPASSSHSLLLALRRPSHPCVVKRFSLLRRTVATPLTHPHRRSRSRPPHRVHDTEQHQPHTHNTPRASGSVMHCTHVQLSKDTHTHVYARQCTQKHRRGERGERKRATLRLRRIAQRLTRHCALSNPRPPSRPSIDVDHSTHKAVTPRTLAGHEAVHQVHTLEAPVSPALSSGTRVRSCRGTQLHPSSSV